MLLTTNINTYANSFLYHGHFQLLLCDKGGLQLVVSFACVRSQSCIDRTESLLSCRYQAPSTEHQYEAAYAF
jgi:hypothetical protein